MSAQTDRDTLRAQYTAAAAHEVALGQMRFQAMAIFLTAAVLIADHLTTQRHGEAALLVALGLGMLMLDLRNRTLVWDARKHRKAFKEQLGCADIQQAARDTGRFRVITHTTVFDLFYGGVLGYAIALFLPRSTWLIESACAVGVGVALVAVMHRCAKRLQKRGVSDAAC